MIKTQAT